MATVKIGIIAGTGFYNLPALAGAIATPVETQYGKALITKGSWHSAEIVFLTRHGVDHSVPPSKVNYRANITALKNEGVEFVIAVNVVGGIDPKLGAGALQLLDDFVDFTSGREHTFFDGVQPGGVQHTDMSDLYDHQVKSAMVASAIAAGIPLATGGVYAGFNGPRFETPAEIRLAALAGATVVGMTGCPEVSLAKEASLRYAAIALVVNPAAGVGTTPITMDEINQALKDASQKVITIIDGAIKSL
ncbi:MAG: S-methyl-5'-thioinosine phosphorylase, partial [Actinobacteria bacterium]|nr:S-methyl-5'-thioinosine phosphorylase [Actinomycetota bacterium]